MARKPKGKPGNRTRQAKRKPFAYGVAFVVFLSVTAQVAAGESLLPKLLAKFEEALSQGKPVEASLMGEGSLWLANRVFSNQESAAEIERSMELLAESYVSQRHYANAQRVYEELLVKKSQKTGAETPEVATVLWRLGDIQAMQGNTQPAWTLFENAMAIERKTVPRKDPRLTDHMISLGNFYSSLGKAEFAEKYYMNALSIRMETFGEQHPSVASATLVLAEFYRAQHQSEKAEQFYKVALSAQSLNGGDDKELNTGMTSILMARFYDTQGNAEQSQSFYSRGAVTLAKSYGISAKALPSLDAAVIAELEPGESNISRALEQLTPLQIAESLKNEAEAYVKLKVANRARRAIEQSLEAYERVLDPSDAELSKIMLEHADMLKQIGDKYAGDLLERRAAQIPRH